MRYRSPHAAGSGSAPLALRGPKSIRTAVTVMSAIAIGIVPALTFSAPAFAAAAPGDLVLGPASGPTTEGGTISIPWTWNGTGSASYSLAWTPGVANTASQARYASLPATISVDDVTLDTGTITIPVTNDSLYEGTQTLAVVATSGADVTSSVPATILDNDAAPSYTLTATPGSVTEPASAGTTTTAVSARLSAVSGVDTVITVNTADGTAKQPGNYTQVVGGTLTVPAGQLLSSTTQSVTVRGDGVKDAIDTMSFTVNGSSTQASPTTASTSINIIDSQTTPRLTLSGGGAVAEGNNVTFTVTPSVQSQLPITFKWDAVAVTPVTGDDQATPGADFTYPDNRTVTIAPNTASADIVIPLINDNLNENAEDYAIKISTPTNATLGDTVQVGGSITDANAAAKPTIAITPTAVTEGDSGKSTKTFTATLSQASGRTVSAKWATVDDSVAVGHAIVGKDYVAGSGTLAFPAGTTTQTFTVDVLGDTIDEGTGETFNVNLTAPVGDTTANLGSPTSAITITDDDATPTMTFDDLSTKEGDAPGALLMPVKLSNASDHDIVFNMTDTTAGNNGTASSTITANAGSNDYMLLNTTVTVPAGAMSGYFVVLDNGDMVYEPDETAYFTATTDSGSTSYVATTAKTAKLTLLNDDKAPSLEVNSVAGHEGDTVSVTGTVTGISQTDTNVTVWFAGKSVKGSKAADESDYVNPGVIAVTIPQSTMPSTILPITKVTLNDDTVAEPAETILASGSGVGNVGSVTDGVITIAPSDGGTTPPPGGGAPTIMAPTWVTGAVAVPISGKAGPGATVELWGAPWSTASASPVKLDQTTAGKDGSYSFSRWIGTGYVFQTAVGDKQSDVAKVGITQAPVFVASTTTGKLSLAVQGNPRGAKQVVIVQVLSGGKWVNTWKGTTGSDNLWKATVSEKSKSSWSLRAFVQGDLNVGINGGYSATKKITIK
jgi:hypothetical protein